MDARSRYAGNFAMPAEHSILIVDDEPNLRSTMAWILQRAGYPVSTAADGREALKQLYEAKFDLIFLDLKMPGIDGIQLLPDILRINPYLPVIILTADSSLESATEALRLGAYGYLLKPVEPFQIIARVGEILAKNPKSN